jgi:hypothetical protein
MIKPTFYALLTGVALCFSLSTRAQQTTEELINLLVKKQLIPQSEADSLRAENAVKAASTDKFKPNGKVWGTVFSDIGYKAHTDSVKRGKGSNYLYSALPQDSAFLDLRRVYLGYDFNISERFSTEFLLAHEGDYLPTITTGTVTSVANGNRTFYLRLANLRWKNIYKRADVVIGQVNTPTFSYSTDKVWGYRSVERTVTDLNKLGGSNDVGVLLQGTFDSKGDYGYNAMVGQGTGAKPENNKFKKFYGNVYARFLNQQLLIDLYADYELQRQQYKGYHKENSTYKVLLAYQSEKFTIGFEVVTQKQTNATIYTEPDPVNSHIKGTKKDTVAAVPLALSVFVRAPLIKDQLTAFARYDNYNPDTKFRASNFYSAPVAANVEQNFVTAGVDFTPYKTKNVHLIPNIWYNRFQAHNDGAQKVNTSLLHHDYDLVYRLTINYIFR